MPEQAYAKVCTICGQTKPATEYHRDRSKADGRDPRCKPCTNARQRQLNAANREHQRERSRRYDAGELGARRREQAKKWREANRDKIAAHQAVQKAINNGTLSRPDCCQCCGRNPGRGHDGRPLIEAHHTDYAQPLDVRWLCSGCHHHEHREAA